MRQWHHDVSMSLSLNCILLLIKSNISIPPTKGVVVLLLPLQSSIIGLAIALMCVETGDSILIDPRPAALELLWS